MIDEKTTCAFSGHRNLPETAELRDSIKSAVQELYDKKGVTAFLTGMARGFDLMAAEVIADLKSEYPDMLLYAIIPCLSQEKSYNPRDKERYAYLMKRADEIIYTNELYTPWCMHKRDDYLVAHADYMICYLSRNEGGTFYTVSQAQKKAIPIKNLV